jgi:hypothetical protein
MNKNSKFVFSFYKLDFRAFMRDVPVLIKYNTLSLVCRNERNVRLIETKFMLYKEPTRCNIGSVFISHCKITLHVSDAFCVHHQEY